jgi:cytochrome c peroxidase
MRAATLGALLLACGPSSTCRWPELTDKECAQVEALALPPLPPARGNLLGDDDDAAALGYQLFFDLDSLSPGAIRCASCHVPEQAFATHDPQPRGLKRSPRNALSLTNAARTFPHFWDGSADSVWSQTLVAIERPQELGGDRLSVVRKVITAYPTAWGKLFGALPDLSALPTNGKPGDHAWNALSEADQQRVNSLFANVGKVLEAYVRKLARGPSALDRFIAGETIALTASQRQGLAVFVRAGCVGCHAGPNLSDGAFHRLDAPLSSDPALRATAEPDRGRIDGLLVLRQSEFNVTSPFFDGEKAPLVDAPPVSGDGYFLTPSLRNVSLTAPYGHAGVFPTLEAVVRFHLAGGGPACDELRPRPLAEAELAALLDFLTALEGEPAPPRWASWPGAYTP